MKNKLLEGLIQRFSNKVLDELLEEISVLEPGLWENELSNTGLKDWYAIATDEGIIAYFDNEDEAFYYRLSLINRILNS